MGTSRSVQARQVARQRRAAMQAQRRARETRIEDAATASIVAAEVLVRTQDAVAQAELALGQTMAALAAEGLGVVEIATLTDFPPGQVRRLLTLAKSHPGDGVDASRDAAGTGHAGERAVRPDRVGEHPARGGGTSSAAGVVATKLATGQVAAERTPPATAP